MFSALAIADSSVLLDVLARCVCARTSDRQERRSTFLPRIELATRLSFCGLTRSMDRVTARLRCRRAVRSVFGGLAHHLAPFRLLVGGVAVIGAGRRELAELVPNHILGDQHRNVLAPVMDSRRSGPTNCGRMVERLLQILMIADLRAGDLCGGFCLLEQIAVDERAFPNRSCHDVSPLSFLLRR